MKTHSKYSWYVTKKLNYALKNMRTYLVFRESIPKIDFLVFNFPPTYSY